MLQSQEHLRGSTEPVNGRERKIIAIVRIIPLALHQIDFIASFLYKLHTYPTDFIHNMYSVHCTRSDEQTSRLIWQCSFHYTKWSRQLSSERQNNSGFSSRYASIFPFLSWDKTIRPINCFQILNVAKELLNFLLENIFLVNSIYSKLFMSYI